MYKLPCPDNVLYLELVGKQPPLGTATKVVSLRPATGMRYIRTTGTMSTSQLLCDLISVTAEASYLCIRHKVRATPAQLPVVRRLELIISEMENHLQMPYR